MDILVIAIAIYIIGGIFFYGVYNKMWYDDESAALAGLFWPLYVPAHIVYNIGSFIGRIFL
jgi:hypothetical protein